ncbi:DUF3419 family protein [Rhizobium sp. L1K21]|uniref:DUF3419 family protein n=1 Tax=Rhizobium sp. L1K21 TaxID=2954933 RepID=UPI002092E7D3|nr:DUF3419 family protein [Rhizobium sp. L1K21]MCO6185624.1 DUF3419 family protein [Rhizobium sp. L1K21]
MTGMAPITGYLKNNQLKSAFVRHRALSKEGFSERLFGLLFSGLVYPQIWEDPDVDLAAMEMEPGQTIATIGSGGCNMLAYLTAEPSQIDVVDLNHHHIALNRLKLAAFKHLPSHADVLRMFALTGVKTNSRSFDTFIAPFLDADTLKYWNGRDARGRRRITIFDRDIYKTGLLGRFIGAGHLAAKLKGRNLQRLTTARSLHEQREIFESDIAPLFDTKFIRWVTAQKSSLFGLGIPPQQYVELAEGASDGHIASVLRERLKKLACDFPISENYFAWQAFSRRYPTLGEGAPPTYLKAENYPKICANTDRVKVHHRNMTEMLGLKAAQSVDRFVLLDAQDWMTPAQVDALWTEICRTARPDARVIFRTAGARSPLPVKLSSPLLEQWDYLEERSAELHKLDRSAIYGGFHIYRKRA